MKELAEEALDLLNNGRFHITEPGPLYAPVRCFTMRRDEKLRLLLETEAASSATSNAEEPITGRIFSNIEHAKLEGPGGMRAMLDGVLRFSVNITRADGDRGTLREKSSVYRLTITVGNVAKGAFVIDWVANLANSPFVWPESYVTKSHTTVKRTFGRDDAQIVRTERQKTWSHSNSAAKFTIDGRTIYLCSLDHASSEGVLGPGCIVYADVSDEAFRTKVRTAVSFTLGLHLVSLGHTLYGPTWQVLEAEARSAYSLDMRAFELNAMPLVPVNAPSQYKNMINPTILGRAVNAFFAAHDDLDLSKLSWAYWHACAAAIHIAPVHFGALIEELQRRFMQCSKPRGVIDTVVPVTDWRVIEKRLARTIAEGEGTEDQRRALTKKIKTLNRLDQRPMLKAVFAALGLQLSDVEEEAWRRRNEAAHGMPVPEGQSLAAIRDAHLLRGIFHRMLIRMTGASDFYVDYASIGFPHRPLGAPPTGDTLTID